LRIRCIRPFFVAGRGANLCLSSEAISVAETGASAVNVLLRLNRSKKDFFFTSVVELSGVGESIKVLI
jgi:hypothetical protein